MAKLVETNEYDHEKESQEVKLEDILNSIRGMIDDHQLENHDYENANDSYEDEYLQTANIHANNFTENDSDDVLELDQIMNNEILSGAEAMPGRIQPGLAATAPNQTTDKTHNAIKHNDSADEIISGHARIKSAELFGDFANQAEAVVASQENEELDNMVYKLIRPMLKDWLDNNLPDLVENIVREELRRLVPKK